MFQHCSLDEFMGQAKFMFLSFMNSASNFDGHYGWRLDIFSACADAVPKNINSEASVLHNEIWFSYLINLNNMFCAVVQDL